MGNFGATRPRNYLKNTDMKDGDSVAFVTHGVWSEKDFSQMQDGSDTKMVCTAQVILNDAPEAKELTINATSGKSLAEKWGDEGQWAGRIAKVSFVKMLAFGKMADVLCLMPTEERMP